DRASSLMKKDSQLISTPSLATFLRNNITAEDLLNTPKLLDLYAELDDHDIWGSIKFWKESDDFVLRTLSNQLLRRELFRITFANEKTGDLEISALLSKIRATYKLSEEEGQFFIKQGIVSNSAYLPTNQFINILKKTGEILDVAEASDLPNIKAMSQSVQKHFLCAPKSIF
ncbi:MAG: phosphohydrolase, partial [Bacteroidota bacterium]